MKVKYTRGNDGDIIKHGMLAEFVEWWLEVNEGKLRMADPFGGPPYGEICLDYRERLNELKDFPIYKIWDEDNNKYCNGSHLVKRIAKERAEILASDKCQEVCKALKDSKIRPIKCEFPDYDNNLGYSILCPDKYADKFNLIFIDPYNFILDKGDEGDKVYKKIPPMINKNPELFIMAFVIDRFPNDNLTRCEEKTHNDWEEFRNRHGVFSIRCDGYKEGTYSIVLFSKNLKNKTDINKLEERLKKFSEATKKIIPSCEML